jgi:hypothetical protein
MAKTKSTKQTPATTEPATTTAPEQPQPAPAATNYTLTYRKNHPNNRASYGIAGVPGIVVFDLKLFANGKPPATIVLDCPMALPVVKPAKEKSATAA